MPNANACLSCNKPLATYRKHAITCSSTCRSILWRSKQEITVPVKLIFTVQNFESIQCAAEVSGKSLNQYMVDRVMFTEVSQ
jgi:hypothetical protein